MKELIPGFPTCVYLISQQLAKDSLATNIPSDNGNVSVSVQLMENASRHSEQKENTRGQIPPHPFSCHLGETGRSSHVSGLISSLAW